MNPAALGGDGGAIRAEDEDDDDVVCVDLAEDPTFSGLFNRPRLRRRNRPYGLSDWDREQYSADILLNGHYTEGVCLLAFADYLRMTSLPPDGKRRVCLIDGVQMTSLLGWLRLKNADWKQNFLGVYHGSLKKQNVPIDTDIKEFVFMVWFKEPGRDPHYLLYHAMVSERMVEVHDSWIREDGRPVLSLKAIREYTETVLRFVTSVRGIPTSGWKTQHSAIKTPQENNSCGPFTCVKAAHLSHGVPIVPSYRFDNSVREKCYEVVNVQFELVQRDTPISGCLNQNHTG
jgi:hypothetical protein